jgi:hypothetical protein
MLYCSRCQEMVDFNSVSESGPTRAYTLDLEGPVDPTIIRSSSKVVNVCKTCGSKSLFQSKAAFRASQQKAAQEKSSSNVTLIVALVGGLIGGIWLAMVTDPSTNDPVLGFFAGFVGGFIAIGFFAAVISDMINT